MVRLSGCDRPTKLTMSTGRGVSIVLYAVACGITNAVFRPQSPPIVPNIENTFEAIMADKCDYILTVPTFIEVIHRKFYFAPAF